MYTARSVLLLLTVLLPLTLLLLPVTVLLTLLLLLPLTVLLLTVLLMPLTDSAAAGFSTAALGLCFPSLTALTLDSVSCTEEARAETACEPAKA